MAVRNYKAEIDAAHQAADDLRDVLQQLTRDMEDAPAAQKGGFSAGIVQASRAVEDQLKLVRDLNKEAEKGLALEQKKLDLLKQENDARKVREAAAEAFRNSPISTLLGKVGGGIAGGARKLGGKFAATKFGGAVTGLGKKVGNIAAKTGQTVAGGGKELGGAAAAIGGPWVQAATAGKDALFALANSADTLQSSFGPITALVQHIDPNLVERFQMALDDLRAAIGTGLRPALDGAILVAQSLNALFTDLAPTITPIIEQLSQTFSELANSILSEAKPAIEAYLGYLKELLAQGLPIINAFLPLVREILGIYVDYLGALTSIAHEVLPYLTYVIKLLADGITVLVRWIRDTLARVGIGSGSSRGPAQQLDRNNRTTAARTASETTVEQIGEQTRLAAFSGGTIAERQLVTQERILEILGRILVVPPSRTPVADTAN